MARKPSTREWRNHGSGLTWVGTKRKNQISNILAETVAEQGYQRRISGVGVWHNRVE